MGRRQTNPTGRLITLEEFGERHDPPLSYRQMLRYCQQGRVIGATRPGRDWLVAEDGVVLGRVEREGLSPRELAEREGVSRQHVSNLLRRGAIPGAHRMENGQWDIPPDTRLPEHLTEEEKARLIREGRQRQLQRERSKKSGKSRGGQRKASK